MNIIHWKLKTILLYFRTAWMILDFLSLRLQRLPFGEYLIVRLLKHLQKLTKWTHWKAKVLPYSFLAVRKRASLAGGLLSSRNWWEVCINFSCCHNRRWDKERISGNHEIAWWRWKSFYKELWGGGVILVSYPTEWQLDNMGPVAGNNPAERQKEDQKII